MIQKRKKKLEECQAMKMWMLSTRAIQDDGDDRRVHQYVCTG